MKGNLAAYLFLAICVVLALLLLAKSISSLVSGCVFAVALVVLGGLSRRFRNR